MVVVSYLIVSQFLRKDVEVIKIFQNMNQLIIGLLDKIDVFLNTINWRFENADLLNT